VNHHSARVRSAGSQAAARDHRPASPRPTTTNHENHVWRSSSRERLPMP
jgi:hypothetical protein